MSESNRTTVSLSLPILWIFIACLGYFIYGGIHGAMGIFILAVALSISAVLGLIPLFGPFIWWYFAKLMVAKIFILTGITASILTAGLWWGTLVLVIIITLLVTVTVAQWW